MKENHSKVVIEYSDGTVATWFIHDEEIQRIEDRLRDEGGEPDSIQC